MKFRDRKSRVTREKIQRVDFQKWTRDQTCKQTREDTREEMTMMSCLLSLPTMAPRRRSSPFGQGGAVASSTLSGGTWPPSLAVWRDGRAVPGSDPDDGAVPSSVAAEKRRERAVPGSFVDDGAMPPSFAVWREKRGVTAAFLFDAAARQASIAERRHGGGGVAFIRGDAVRPSSFAMKGRGACCTHP